jgi:hypothetical protein
MVNKSARRTMVTPSVSAGFLRTAWDSHGTKVPLSVHRKTACQGFEPSVCAVHRKPFPRAKQGVAKEKSTLAAAVELASTDTSLHPQWCVWGAGWLSH